MLYDEYQQKMTKVAKAVNVARRFKVLIISGILFVIALTVTLMAIHGIILEDGNFPSEITYGDDLNYGASAIFDKIEYEFAPENSVNWTKGRPLTAGRYKVRTVSKNIFGAPKYGAEHSCTILPKTVKVYIAQESVVYGDKPIASGDTAFSDLIECTRFDKKEVDETHEEFTPQLDSIRIKTADGITDVSSSYKIEVVSSVLTVTPRPYSITVEDVEAIYNGEEFKPETVKVGDGGTSVAEGDTPILTITASRTEVGETENQPIVKIINRNNDDVTFKYKLTINPGKIIVKKRPLTIKTGSNQPKIYDGSEISCSDFEISENTPMAAGHTISATDWKRFGAVGTYDNDMSFRITDEERKDVLKNYDITLDKGKITILPRPVNITTADAEWTYDGKVHRKTDGYNLQAPDADSGILSAHVISVKNSTEVLNVSNNVENKIEFVIKENGVDVTKNYEIKVTYGTLAVKPRSVKIKSRSQTWTYDGAEHFDTKIESRDIIQGSLVSGHRVSVLTNASLVNVGTVENVLKVLIWDSREVNVTNNYEIEYENGELSVVERPVTLKARDSEKIYDGQPLTSEFFDVVSELKIVSGHNLTLSTRGSQLNAGIGTNEIILESIEITSGIFDVKFNYKITLQPGELKVSQRPITVTAKDKEKIYDGTALSSSEYELTSEYLPALVGDHKLNVVISGSQTVKGEGVNSITRVSVVSDKNGDVTSNYSITKIDGKLTVNPRPITVTAANDSKIYNGVALTADKYSVSSDYSPAIVNNQKVNVTIKGEKTDAGTSKNIIESVSVSSLDGKTDVTDNYEITTVDGTLTVKPRPVTANSKDYECIYDGEIHSYHEYTVAPAGKDSGIVDGHNYEAGAWSEIVDVGTVRNAFRLIIYYDGIDVTGNYAVSYEYGKLTVNPRPITVITGSGEWAYDGKSHSNPYFEISQDSPYNLLDLHYAQVTEYTKIRDVGIAANELTIVINTLDGKFSVTSNYSITFKNGVLEITWDGDEPPEPYPEDGDLNTSGSLSGPLGSTEDGNPKVAVKVKSDSNGEIYLRLMSFGDFDGKKWDKARSYGETLSGGYNMNYISALALQNAGHSSVNVSIEVTGKDYYIPYYADIGKFGYEIQSNDVFNSGDSSDAYSLKYYLYNYISDGNLSIALGEYAEIERKYAEFVYANYLYVPESTIWVLRGIIDAQKFDSIDSDIVYKVAEYVKKSAKYNLDYDKTLDGENDIIVSFLRDYKEGICQHFASAATLLFRALGIPARYTIGYFGETVAGQTVEITTENAHAWVEVYIDGQGWVYVDVLGDNEHNTEDTENNGEIVIKPADIAKKYDGTPLKANEIEPDSVLSKLLRKGYTYEVAFAGSQTAIGKGVSTVASFVLRAPGGKIDYSQKIIYKTGFLNVTDKDVITLYPYSYHKYYDGTPLSYSADDFNAEGLPSGYRLEFDLTEVGLIEPGELKLKDFGLQVRVLNSKGVDVSDNFFVLIDSSGILQVDKREITVTTASDMKQYDGTPLENKTYWISNGSLAPGHNMTVTISGTITDIGEELNTVSEIIITDADGYDVTENYNITTVPGTLIVIDDYMM